MAYVVVTNDSVVIPAVAIVVVYGDDDVNALFLLHLNREFNFLSI